MKFKIQGAPELAARIRRALDQQDIAGGELDLTFSPELLVQDVSRPPFVQEPVYWAAPEIGAAVAAEIPHAGVRFNGPGLCVVDRILCSNATAGLFIVRFGRTIAALTAGLTTNVHDRADLRGIGVDTIAMSAVQGLQDSDAVQQGTALALINAAANTPVLFDNLDIVMAAGDDVFVTHAAVNTAPAVSLFGRWFPQAVTS